MLKNNYLSTFAHFAAFFTSLIFFICLEIEN